MLKPVSFSLFSWRDSRSVARSVYADGASCSPPPIKNLLPSRTALTLTALRQLIKVACTECIAAEAGLAQDLRQQLLELLDILLELLDLEDSRVELDVGLAGLHLLVPAVRLKVALVQDLLPLVRHVLVALATPPVVNHGARVALLDVGGDDEEGRVDYAHDEVVEVIVARFVHPPFKRQDQEDHLDEVEGRNEDVFVGRAHELHGFLREERHVFVDGVFGDVFVGRVVQRDQDVEQDYHDDKGEDVVENNSEGVLVRG